MGLSVKSYRLIDAAGGGDLTLESVPLRHTTQLTFDAPARAVLHEALEWGLLGLSAEAAGIVGALNRATFPTWGIASSLACHWRRSKHYSTGPQDMFIAAEEIAAAVNCAIDAFDGSATTARSAAVSAAKVVADTGGRLLGHEAVQLHGGMGVSDELNISHYARRLAAIRAELGGADTHRLRFLELQ